jgi:Trp operon repressor
MICLEGEGHGLLGLFSNEMDEKRQQEWKVWIEITRKTLVACRMLRAVRCRAPIFTPSERHELMCRHSFTKYYSYVKCIK